MPKKGIVKKAKKAAEKEMPAQAFHVESQSTHAVGIENIRVILFKEDGVWIAQGLELDYAAYGSTRQQAKKNFEEGLEGTIDLHVKIHQGLKRLLRTAPPEIWEAVYSNNRGTEYRYSQMSLHDDLFKALHPYEGIAFAEPVGEAA